VIDRRFNAGNQTLVNRSAMLAPDDEPEPAPAELMDDCAHCAACLRLLGYLVYGGEIDTGRIGWADDAARILECSECDCWEE